MCYKTYYSLSSMSRTIFNARYKYVIVRLWRGL